MKVFSNSNKKICVRPEQENVVIKGAFELKLSS